MLVGIYVANRVYKLYHCYTEYLRYKKQGVPFADQHGFSFFRDTAALTNGCDKDRYSMPWTEILKGLFEVEELPPVTGLIYLGGAGLVINTADMLEDIFIN